MVMAVNNAALLGSGATDISGLSDSFRDGQKLRQGYDARQQQKALNELMGIQDFNERIAKARTHKYAGALIPELQKYEEARQKAALENLQASADISKTFGETGKLGAETGKIGAETGEIGAKTQGQIIQNASDTQNHISALAVAQDPKVFALGVGQLNKLGVINPMQTEMLINMVGSDPQNAAKVLQSMAMANPEVAKIFKPEAKTLDAGDAIYQYSVNPFTGEANDPSARIEKAASPDNVLDNETSRLNNQNTVAGSMYNSDNSYNASVYSADSRAQTASDAQAVDWFKAQTGANVAQQNADTSRIKANKANTTTTTDGQQVRKLDSKEKGRIIEINEAINADKSVLSTLDQMLNLVSNSYSGAGASLRAKTMSGLGLSGDAADNTVLYDNLATSQALAQLKATFGAAPTEGERKILMDIQASANKTPKQKIAIIRSAVKAVRVRAAYRKAEKEGIQTGRYLIPSGSSQGSSKPKQQSKGNSIIGGILGGG